MDRLDFRSNLFFYETVSIQTFVKLYNELGYSYKINSTLHILSVTWINEGFKQIKQILHVFTYVICQHLFLCPFLQQVSIYAIFLKLIILWIFIILTQLVFNVSIARPYLEIAPFLVLFKIKTAVASWRPTLNVSSQEYHSCLLFVGRVAQVQRLILLVVIDIHVWNIHLSLVLLLYYFC